MEALSKSQLRLALMYRLVFRQVRYFPSAYQQQLLPLLLKRMIMMTTIKAVTWVDYALLD